MIAAFKLYLMRIMMMALHLRREGTTSLGYILIILYSLVITLYIIYIFMILYNT